MKTFGILQNVSPAILEQEVSAQEGVPPVPHPLYDDVALYTIEIETA